MFVVYFRYRTRTIGSGCPHKLFVLDCFPFFFWLRPLFIFFLLVVFCWLRENWQGLCGMKVVLGIEIGDARSLSKEIFLSFHIGSSFVASGFATDQFLCRLCSSHNIFLFFLFNNYVSFSWRDNQSLPTCLEQQMFTNPFTDVTRNNIHFLFYYIFLFMFEKKTRIKTICLYSASSPDRRVICIVCNN